MFDVVQSSPILYTVFVFLRIGSFFATVPIFKEALIPSKVRLGFALCLSYILAIFLSGNNLLPSIESHLFIPVLWIFNEMMIGAVLGLFFQILWTAIEIAGYLIAFSGGISSALMLNPFQKQTTPLSSLMEWGIICMLFMSQFHHALIQLILESYRLFPPLTAIPSDSFLDLMIKTIGKSFMYGVYLAFPFWIFSCLLSVAFALSGRLFPQMPILFISVPTQLIIFVVIAGLILPMIMNQLTDFIHSFQMIMDTN